MESTQSTSSKQHIYSFDCLVVPSIQMNMEAFNFLKKDLITFWPHPRQKIHKMEPICPSIRLDICCVFNNESYSICALFETNSLNEQ